MSASNRIPFEGVLNCWNDEHDLPDLLLLICRAKKTGKLSFSNPEGDKTVHIREGRIVFADSSSGDDGLGHYLLRTGRISLMDYLSVSKLVEPGKRLGTLLVAEGVMEPKDLAPAVLGQVRSIILGLFRRTETWYRFKEEALASETITLDLPVESLILDGVRQVESWRRISKGVGHLESVYLTVDEKKPEWEGVNFPPVVEELFDMMREPVTVAHICTHATLPDFEACRYLWAFRCLGWIEPAAARLKADEAQPEPEAPAAEPVDATPPPPAMPPPTPFPAPPNVSVQVQAQPPVEAATQPSNVKPPVPESESPKPAPLTAEREPAATATATAQMPAPLKTPPIPQKLIETRIAVDKPKPSDSPEPDVASSDADAPDKTPLAAREPEPRPAPSPVRRTTLIPQALTETKVAVEPPSGPMTSSPATKPANAKPIQPPKQVPDHLARTNLAMDPPRPQQPLPLPQPPTPTTLSPAQRADSEPTPTVPPARPVSVREDLMHTNLAVDSPVTAKRETGADKAPSPTEPPNPESSSSPNPAHTQLFIDPPAFEPPPPRSTGEMMEAILSDDSSPDLGPALPVTPRASESTQVFDPRAAYGARDEAPAGFEALAFDDSDPSVSSIEDISLPSVHGDPGPVQPSAPEPQASATEPDDAPIFEEEDALASFQDLAYDSISNPEPEPEPEPELEPEPEMEVQAQAQTVVEPEPVVEASLAEEPVMPVVEAEPHAVSAEPPILAPPPPPPRKRSPDEAFDLDNDGLAHLLRSND